MAQCTHMICGQPLHYSKPDQIPSIAVVIQKSWAWHIKKRPNSEKISLYPLKKKGVPYTNYLICQTSLPIWPVFLLRSHQMRI